MEMPRDEYLREWLLYHLPLAVGTQRDKMLMKYIPKDITLLDIGCGTGCLKVFGEHPSTGVDICDDSLNVAKQRGKFQLLLKCDVRNLPFTEKSFDGVVCTEVIEHLSKQDGYKLIDDLERIARKIVIYTTPWGADLLPRHSFNPYMNHQCGWLPEEFEERGYKIYPLNTLRYLKFGDYWWHSMMHYGVSFLSSPIVAMFPRKLSDNFMAIKELK
jgi:ubiquinone/menaquinone biosynthesis C-methylase UbiE